MVAINVRRAGHEKHGTVKPPCNSCKELMKVFKIESSQF